VGFNTLDYIFLFNVFMAWTCTTLSTVVLVLALYNFTYFWSVV